MSKYIAKLKLEKSKQLYADLRRASQRLKQISNAPYSIANRDLTIQRFDFTFEIAWKLIKTLVELQGLKPAGARTSIRLAADMGLLNKPEKWLKFLDIRNETIHIYKEEMIERVYPVAKKFTNFVDQLLTAAKTHLDS